MSRWSWVLVLGILVTSAPASAFAPTVPGHYTLDRVATDQVRDALADRPDPLLVLAACQGHVASGDPLDPARRAFPDADRPDLDVTERAWLVHAALCLHQATGNATHRDRARDLARDLETDATRPFEQGLAATALLRLANATDASSDRATGLLDRAAAEWFDGTGYRRSGRYRSDAHGILTLATALAHRTTDAPRFENRTRATGSFLLNNLSRPTFPPAVNASGPTDQDLRTDDQLYGYMGLVAFGRVLDNETAVERALRVDEALMFLIRRIDMDRGRFVDRSDEPDARAAALAMVSHAHRIGYEVSTTRTTAELEIRADDQVTAQGRWNRTAWGNVSTDGEPRRQHLIGPVEAVGVERNPRFRGPQGPVEPIRLHQLVEDRLEPAYVGTLSGGYFVAVMNVTPPETPYRFHQQLPVVVEDAERRDDRLVVEGNASSPVTADPLRLRIPGVEDAGTVRLDGEVVPVRTDGSDRVSTGPVTFQGAFTLTVALPAGGPSLEITPPPPSVVAGLFVAASATILLMVYTISLRRRPE